ncbi:MAG: alpha-amylase family glycosyl hydrolase [Sedimentisphaerales bacterium]
MDSKQNTAVENATPGAIDHGDGWVSFAIYAPDKQSVNLIGSFNNWDYRRTPLEQKQPGYWMAAFQLDKGTYQYQFLIDKELVICDPYARWTAPGEKDSDQPKAVIEVGKEPYKWEHDDWMRPELHDMIIYEMHIGDFTKEGTFAAATQKLDHLKDLGISGIQLMPICEVPPDDYWGYKPTYLMAPRHSYGSPDDFRRFVDAAHANDMAVILDMVIAHTGQEHPFNKMYPYENSPWYGQGLGEQNQFGLPTFSYLKEPTNNFARDVEFHWLQAYHIDGYRYDYLAGIGADAHGKGLPNLMEKVREIQPDAYFIGECIPEDPDLVNNSGLSAVWHTRCRIALQTLLFEKDIEPYSPFRFAEAVSAFNPSTQGYSDAMFMVNYAECHDDKRLMLGLREAGFDEDTAAKKHTLAAAILMTIPGEPMLYQGQECGHATEKSLQQNKINWKKCDTNSGKYLLDHYRKMCKLRRSRSSIRSNNFNMAQVDEQKRCIVFQRMLGESDQVIVAANFSGQKQNLTIPLPQKGYWHELEGEPFEAENSIDRLIEPYSAAIFLSGES